MYSLPWNTRRLLDLDIYIHRVYLEKADKNPQISERDLLGRLV